MRRTVFGAALAVAAGMLAAAVPPKVPPAAQQEPAFREFTQRIQDYLKLEKAAPRLRKTKKPAELVARRNALAQHIRETRSYAKQGDIFTPAVSEAFRRVIHSTFHGPNAANVRKTIRPGEPVRVWHPSVNGAYPDDLPSTTVPPSLLLHLPQLPAQVAYRIVGHDFVLQDTEARVVIDFIPGAIP